MPSSTMVTLRAEKIPMSDLLTKLQTVKPQNISTTDVKLMCSDGYVPAHSIVLKMASTFFSDLLSEYMKQPIPLELIVIILPDIFEVAIVRKVIQMMYTGYTTMSNDEEWQKVKEVLEILKINDSSSFTFTDEVDFDEDYLPLLYYKRAKQCLENSDSEVEIFGTQIIDADNENNAEMPEANNDNDAEMPVASNNDAEMPVASNNDAEMPVANNDNDAEMPVANNDNDAGMPKNNMDDVTTTAHAQVEEAAELAEQPTTADTDSAELHEPMNGVAGEDGGGDGDDERDEDDGHDSSDIEVISNPPKSKTKTTQEAEIFVVSDDDSDVTITDGKDNNVNNSSPAKQKEKETVSKSKKPDLARKRYLRPRPRSLRQLRERPRKESKQSSISGSDSNKQSNSESSSESEEKQDFSTRPNRRLRPRIPSLEGLGATLSKIRSPPGPSQRTKTRRSSSLSTEINMNTLPSPKKRNKKSKSPEPKEKDQSDSNDSDGSYIYKSSISDDDDADSDYENKKHARYLEAAKKCGKCGTVYPDGKGASSCVTENHKMVRCYFCFKVIRNTEKLFEHYRTMHKQAGKEEHLLCGMCQQPISYKSVSTHVISTHLFDKNKKDETAATTNSTTAATTNTNAASTSSRSKSPIAPPPHHPPKIFPRGIKRTGRVSLPVESEEHDGAKIPSDDDSDEDDDDSNDEDLVDGGMVIKKKTSTGQKVYKMGRN